jgi:5'-nucleotidase/UDP-sugar diphosphatase
MWILILIFFAAPTQAATLIYTNDVLGEIDPCGCRVNPYGGMLRKAGLIESLKKKGEKEFLQLDAGDLLFESREIPASMAKAALLQAENLLKAHELLGHQVVVPGEKDFALGVKTFQTLTKKTKIKFLAANLELNGKNFLEPHTHYEFELPENKRLKIAVIGILGDDLTLPAELTVKPALPIVKKWVEDNRKNFDLLVVVSHQGLEKDQTMAQSISGIDIVVGAHSQSFLQSPEVIGKTQVLQSSFRNQYVGVMGLNPGVFPTQHELVGLEEKFEHKPLAPLTVKMKKLISDFKIELKKLKARNPYASNFRN